ncbi:MAG: Fic family protein [bacterium]|nr:Fic family protein [bacterium]
MGELVQGYWSPLFEGPRRADRLAGHYDAFVPDRLCGWEFAIPARLAGNLAEAEASVRALNGRRSLDLEGLGRFLLRAESVGSSWIEGLGVSADRLAVATAAIEREADTGDRLAEEVAANVLAMAAAVRAARRGDRFSLEDLLEVHRTLMRRSPRPEWGGQVRVRQNWIGGSEYTPIGARFISPPSEAVPELLEDLIDYVNGDEHPPLLQAALAHAQFEMIHPFGDGNGRAGRALVHVVLARRGLAPRFVPPVSVVLARRAEEYVAALQRCAHVGPPDSPDRAAAVVDWLWLFDAAMAQAADRALAYGDDIAVLQEQWRAEVGAVRADSSVARLLRILPGSPVLSVDSASRRLGVNPSRVGPAVNTLVEAGVLAQRNVGRQRYRVFAAPAVLDLYAAVDAELVTPPTPATSPPGLGL